MKIQESFNQLDLRVDALEYLFVEWLVRNRLYCKYARNLEASGHVATSVRDCIRDLVRLCALSHFINYSGLLAGSFAFEHTPEGRKFWNESSRRWEDFCRTFFLVLSESF